MLASLRSVFNHPGLRRFLVRLRLSFLSPYRLHVDGELSEDQLGFLPLLPAGNRDVHGVDQEVTLDLEVGELPG